MTLIVVIREAIAADLPALIALFANDAIGGHGDTDDPAQFHCYETAFRAIKQSNENRLFVAELDGAIVGTMQITLTRTLTGRGSIKATLEAVQVDEQLRSRGIGRALVEHGITLADEAGASLIQLMSNANRTRAHAFYERLGFAKSHTGFKMRLPTGR